VIVASSIDWTMVITALIVGAPAIIAAIYAGRVHHQIKTPSGKPLGAVAEYAHDTAIANNMLLSKANGHTKPADHDTLSAGGKLPPHIPDPPPPIDPVP
jgi:hypothetical protein